MIQGLYVGLDTSQFAAAKAWLGGNVGMIAAQTGRASWSDWTGTIAWEINNLKGTDATARWSIPLFANQGNLKAAAAGAYDSYYLQAAKQLVAAYGTSSPIIVRVGEEFNGTWMPWAAGTDPADYVKAYQNFVDAFRSVGGNFKFEWNVAQAGSGMDPATAYPGDKYVDYVGMDFYWDSKQSWSITDPVEAFNYMKNSKYGLQWLENFAAAHGKQTAYSEWGVNSSNGSQYIALVKQWFDSHNVAYENYWDSNASFAGQLDNGQYGATGDTFQSLFGSQTSITATATTTLASGQVNLTLSGSTAINGTGNAAGNVLTGNSAANVLNGLAGNDTLVGGKGDDTLTGGVGVDTFQFAPGSGHDTITDFGAGGEKDVIDISAYLKAGSKATLTQIGNDTKISFASGDSILVKNMATDGLLATTSGYTLKADFFATSGTEQTNHSAPMWGHTWDKIDTAGDKDWFKVDLTKGQVMNIAVEAGGSGMGTLADAKVSVYDANGNLVASDDNSGSGNDALAHFTVGTTGTYYIVVESADGKGTGSYMLVPTYFNMVFDTGNHHEIGTAAADDIVGSTFNDIMTGGAGNDRFQMGLHGGHDTITDFHAGDLIDTMAYTQAGLKPTVTAHGSDTVISFGDGSDITLLGVKPSDLATTYWGFIHA